MIFNMGILIVGYGTVGVSFCAFSLMIAMRLQKAQKMYKEFESKL